MQTKPTTIATSAGASDARLCAVGALMHTLDKAKPLDGFWPQDRYFQMLSPSDRAFAQLLVKTTLRRLGQIDALLAQLMEKPVSAPRIVHTLRLGAAQLLFLGTPPHAAVHSSVELAKQLKLERLSGLVNAVLKKIAQDGAKLISTDDAAAICTPAWLYASWLSAYGKDTAHAIASSHLSEAPLDISVKKNPAQWAETLGGQLLPNGTIRLAQARGLTQLAGFAEGEWWVQDVAASLPAMLLGNVKGRQVIDLCAAPGGKTAQLIAAGAKVTAVDQSKERMALLKANLHRLKFSADYVVANALKYTPASAPDAILLDAPCSATGTARRHPDVLRHRTSDDISRLTQTQAALLERAADMLKPGGTLVYAVCSLQPQEGEAQIEKFLAQRKDMALQAIRPADIGGLTECITKRGELRTLPCHLAESGGMDGFYAVILNKK
ncbi:MAG: transcription antitermination factor NusB [Alphaproteobacteria bacterium]|nr:transcription antitermination factor NusB [Alphaproteobacteria bacterium]